MFYESERIVTKQLRYTKLRAYDIIQGLELKGLDDKEIVSCIKILLKDSGSEFQTDVLKLALETVNSRQEPADAETLDSSFSFVDGRVQRKSERRLNTKPKKSKALRRNKNRKSS